MSRKHNFKDHQFRFLSNVNTFQTFPSNFVAVKFSRLSENNKTISKELLAKKFCCTKLNQICLGKEITSYGESSRIRGTKI